MVKIWTIVKQNHDLNTVSYHKLFDVLKQYQKEVNEIRAERIAKNANPLALIYKPTNNNFRTSSNSRNKNVDTSLRYKNHNQTRQFGNQRILIVARARETIGSQVVHQTRIQCFNCKEFGHFAKECRKPKRVEDYTYHKEKMLLCKQAEKGVPLQSEQANWLEDMNKEIDKQELEAHYSYMAKIQEVPTTDLGTDTKPLEKVDSNAIPDSPDMCNNDIQTDQNAEECDDECAVLANLIENLTLDTEENKKILKQLKKANASLTQELKECKSNLEESNTIRDSCLIALQSKQTKIPYDTFDPANRFVLDREETLTLEKESRSKWNKDLVKPYDYTKQNSLYEKFKPAHDQLAHANEMLTLNCNAYIFIKYLHKVKEYECLAQKLSKQTETISNEVSNELLRICIEKASTVFLKEREQYFEIQDLKAQLQDKNIAISELKKLIEKCKRKSVETKFDKPSVVRQPNAQRIPKPSVLGKPTPFSDSLERESFSNTKSVPKTNVSEGLSKSVTSQSIPQTARQAIRNINVIKPGMYQIDTRTTQTRAPQLSQTSRNTDRRVYLYNSNS
ncbi:integrase, catalytic region, zinc finger, CCHC-type containing protein [Tanacetum coccineum]